MLLSLLSSSWACGLRRRSAASVPPLVRSMQVQEQLDRALAPYGMKAESFMVQNPTLAKDIESACLSGTVATGKELR